MMATDSMDILPVLTPRFLDFQNDNDEHGGYASLTNTPYCHHDPQAATFLNDNTHKYLTDRWLSKTNPSNDANKHDRRCIIPRFSQEEQAAPMWISPTNSPQATLGASLALAAVFPSLPSIPNMSASPLAPTKPKVEVVRDVPAVIFIRIPLSNGTGMMMMNFPEPACLFLEEDDDVVSSLADNPDEDDVGVLPHSTYDVLASIFDEIYKDDSEVHDDDDDHDHDIDDDEIVEASHG
jgi:hypothetical protein